MDWIVQKLVYTSPFVAVAATFGISAWLRNHGVGRRQVQFLLVLAMGNCVLAVLILGASRSELESFGYEFLLPLFVAVSIWIIGTAGYLLVGRAETGRLIAVCILWFVAAASFIWFSVSEYFNHLL